MTIYDYLKRTQVERTKPPKPRCGYCRTGRWPMHTDHVLRSVEAVLCDRCYEQFMEEQVGVTR